MGIEYASISEVAVMLRNRTTTAVKLTKLMLDRIAETHKELNAYITVTSDLALEQAQQADLELSEGLDRGPLHGIPVAVKDLIDTFLQAGEVSLELREKGLVKETKPDNTPVSNGDIEVNKILTKKISEITPNILIISEENSENKENDNLKDFWLIDPIDGTRDYINNKDEFTLNAALILNKRPAIGIITAPAKKRVFYSYALSNSYELVGNQEIELINKKKNYKETKALSYSNTLKPEILKIHKEHNIKSYQKMKSSLKFCAVAAGEFDLYAAEPRACEWDIAAGHALVIHAGGKVTDFNNKEIYYGKANFKNSSIIIKNKNIL
mgnify:CR=1 FL=1